MSLNSLLRNQPKPWLNIRVNDLVVDGNLTIGSDLVFSNLILDTLTVASDSMLTNVIAGNINLGYSDQSLVVSNGSGDLTELPIGSNTEVLTVNGGLISWQPSGGGSSYTPSIAILSETQTSGTGGNGGSGGSSQTWTRRLINTIEHNDNTIVSINNNLFTLVAGEYLIEIDVPGCGCSSHKSRLYNNTQTSIVSYGSNEVTTEPGVQTNSKIKCKITSNGTDEYEIQHWVDSLNANDSDYTRGFAISEGFPENYTKIVINKLD